MREALEFKEWQTEHGGRRFYEGNFLVGRMGKRA